MEKKIKSAKELSVNRKEMLKKLQERRDALREFRFGVSGSKIKNIKEAVVIKKEIARILTKLNEEKHG